MEFPYILYKSLHVKSSILINQQGVATYTYRNMKFRFALMLFSEIDEVQLVKLWLGDILVIRYSDYSISYHSLSGRQVDEIIAQLKPNLRPSKFVPNTTIQSQKEIFSRHHD